MSKIRLTLACGDYEIVRALIEREVEPEGVELEIHTDMTAEVRHWRAIRDREFDIAELSMSNYLIAHDRGLPFAALPVFLHRRFRHGFVFVNPRAVRRPADLVGKRAGLGNFQSTSNVWVRGILEHEFGVPQREILWFKQEEDVIEIAPRGFRVERLAAGKEIEAMLLAGELDAVIHPEVIRPVAERRPEARRLFENYKDLEIDYYRRTGIFPIMHTTAIRRDLLEKHPWLPASLMGAFEKAKEIAYRRMENPRRVPLAWFLTAWEEQREILGKDPWAYGLGEQNRKNLETLIGYCFEQGLIEKRPGLEEIFVT